MNTRQTNSLLPIVVVLAQVIAESGTDGVRGTSLYAVLICHGVIFENFKQLMQAMEKLELVRKEPRGGRYIITAKGRKLAAYPMRPAAQTTTQVQEL